MGPCAGEHSMSWIRLCVSASLSSSIWIRSRSAAFSSRSTRVVRCESASALSSAPVSSACFSCRSWISDWAADAAEMDVAAVDALEDKASGVRKNAVALLERLVLTHPYGMYGGFLSEAE